MPVPVDVALDSPGDVVGPAAVAVLSSVGPVVGSSVLSAAAPGAGPSSAACSGTA
ncbi:hypothetical protein JGS22_008745 [Streptomyces sp. P38-E01]|uniref:Uncharacterized protein n=1 Tax=Streptomyces tardus TaxID=2780544 RepID=A0A949JEX4_9ACTN|nr:hypothetical protein [Streptomyces tardus]MBU7597703.1 hypothetical protein [Streptomyces tardus]